MRVPAGDQRVNKVLNNELTKRKFFRKPLEFPVLSRSACVLGGASFNRIATGGASWR